MAADKDVYEGLPKSWLPDPGRSALQTWVNNLSKVSHGENVDAFWNNTTTVFPSGQAAIAALYYGELLDCRGKPGSMKFYIGARWLPFTKVTHVASVFLWYLLFLTIVLPIMFSLETKESYQIAIGLSVVGFIGYAAKAFIYSAYRMLVTAVPGNMTQNTFFIKLGLYHMGWMTCVIMFYVAYRELSSGELENIGYIESLALVWHWFKETIIHIKVMLFSLDGGWWDLSIRWFKHVIAYIVMGFIVGATVSPSDRPSLVLLNQHGLFDRYSARGAKWVEQAGVGVVYALLLSIYAGMHVMHSYVIG